MKIVRAVIGVFGMTALVFGQIATQSSEEAQQSYLWKQCDEEALIFHVEPGPLESLVPRHHSLVLEGGKARVLIAAQNCPSYWFDGEDIGATLEVHHWAAIRGKGDVREVAGAERTLPTMTWIALFTGSSNPRSVEQWNRSGSTAHEIESLSLVAPQPSGGGRVSIAKGLEYSWQSKRRQPVARIIGVNHDVFSTNPDGDLVYHRIQCLGRVFAWASEGSLKVTGGTEPTKIIGTGTYPVAVHTFLPIWCRASLADSPPE